jgi:phage terminase Nu1 subunit (DNA packaging protein)
MTVRFHNLSAYKAFVISFLIRKLNEVADEKTKTLLQELIGRAEVLRTRDFYRFLARVFEIQQQTELNLSAIIPTDEEVQQIFQYPA